MKRPYFLILLFLTICPFAKGETNGLSQVVLIDVQGLHGGTDLWISKNGKAIVRFAKPPTKEETGLQETRYSFTLSKEQLTSLLDMVKKHRFFDLQSSTRSAVPDEAHPVIFIKLGDRTHAAMKWANDKNKDFDPIYEFLLKLAKSGKNGTEMKKGSYDWNWKPENFPASKEILTKTEKK